MKMKKIRSSRSKEEERKACFGQFHTDGIRSFPHDERGKWCTKSVPVYQSEGI